MTNLIHQQKKLERITRRWWFYGLFVLMQFTIPPYASKGYRIEDWGNVIMHALSRAIVHQYSEIYPIFKVPYDEIFIVNENLFTITIYHK